MADVRPFRGIRYNASVVGGYSRVICPPYDVISPEEAEGLRRQGPFNAVNLELPKGLPGDDEKENCYTRASGLYRRWLRDGVLHREASPAMYLVEEEFQLNGVGRRRRELMAAVRLEEFKRGIVLPHEHTTPGPKADRLALVKAAGCMFSPLMTLYRDVDGSVGQILDERMRAQPELEARPPGLPTCKVWKVSGPEALSGLQEAFSSLKLFLADGHHRYETALRYRKDLEAAQGPLPRDGAANFVMMALVALDDPGLVMLPYHRLVGGLSNVEVESLKKRLKGEFQVEAVSLVGGDPEEAASWLGEGLRTYSEGDFVVGVLGLEPGKAHIVRLPEAGLRGVGASPLERCDAWMVQEKILGPALGTEKAGAEVSFAHDAAEAVEGVAGGRHQLAFLLRPMPLGLFQEVVGGGHRLPPKSTYFYPKLPTGLVFHGLEGGL